MRGKRAKYLRRQAMLYVRDIEKKPLGTGYNEYKYVENRVDWIPQLDDDGHTMPDPETGQPLMRPAMVRGTIFCAYLVRMVYQRLKKAHYANEAIRS